MIYELNLIDLPLMSWLTTIDAFYCVLSWIHDIYSYLFPEAPMNIGLLMSDGSDASSTDSSDIGTGTIDTGTVDTGLTVPSEGEPNDNDDEEDEDEMDEELDEESGDEMDLDLPNNTDDLKLELSDKVVGAYEQREDLLDKVTNLEDEITPNTEVDSGNKLEVLYRLDNINRQLNSENEGQLYDELYDKVDPGNTEPINPEELSDIQASVDSYEQQGNNLEMCLNKVEFLWESVKNKDTFDQESFNNGLRELDNDLNENNEN